MNIVERQHRYHCGFLTYMRVRINEKIMHRENSKKKVHSKKKKKNAREHRIIVYMSRRAHSNEGDDLTSEPQTLEVMVLATVPSTQEATTPLSCFIIAQLSVIPYFPGDKPHGV